MGGHKKNVRAPKKKNRTMKKWFKGKKQAGNELDADQSAMPKRAREEGGEEVQSELAETKAAIKKVEKEIGEVEKKIDVVEQQQEKNEALLEPALQELGDGVGASEELKKRVQRLEKKEEQLRDKEKQLREEKKQLGEEKKQLREEKKLLLERLARLEGGGAKRAKFLDRGGKGYTEMMFAGLHRTEMKDGWLHLAERVLSTTTKLIRERECYRELFDEMWKRAKRGDEFYPVEICGTSGIGKSFFGIYAIWRSVLERKITVIYTRQLSGGTVPERYVIAPPIATMRSFPEEDPGRLLLELCGDNVGDNFVDDEDVGKSIWWGKVDESADGKRFVEKLKAGEKTWVFWDVEEGRVTEGTRRGFVVASKQAAAQSYLKHVGGVTLWAPVWTLEELKTARPMLQPGLTDKDVKERYDLVGGVARAVFVEDWDQLVVKFKDRLSSLNSGKMDEMLNPEARTDVTTQLVHYDTGPYTMSKQVFASKYVQTKVYEQFLRGQRFEMSLLIKYAKGLMSGSALGAKFEWFAHVTLRDFVEELDVNVARLVQGGADAPVHAKLKPFATNTRSFDHMDRLTTITFNTYYQPSTDNFAAIDSWCLLRGCPWDEAKPQDPTLLLFQMTVAQDKHDTVGEPLKKIIGRVNDLTDFNQKRHPIFLIFITDSDNISRAEPYLTSGRPRTQLQENNLGVLKRIQQLRMRVNEEQKLKQCS